MNAMNRKGKVDALVIGLALLLICFTVFVAFEQEKQELADVSGLARSPGVMEQFESVWGAAIEATKPIVTVPLPAPKPAPDTWEHWFPTVPKP